MQKSGDEVFPLANGGRPWGWRVNEGINEEECGFWDILMEKIFWEFGGRKEGKEKKKEKGKGKEIIKREDIFSNSKN